VARQLRQKNENVRMVVEGCRNTCRETERGTTGRSSMAGRETRRRQGARVVVSRGGGRTRDETAAGGSGGGLAWWWLDARRDGGGWMRDETAVAGGSRGGLEWWARRKSQREDETAMTAAQRW